MYLKGKGFFFIKKFHRIDQKTNLYENNVAILKDYGLKKKLVLCNTLRKKGFEEEIEKRERGTVNENKLDQSISRTKSRIFELAYCNPWDLFVTLTLNPKNYDRSDLSKFKSNLSQWIRNYNKKHKTSVKYLLIPEMHEDGNWHMHGFIMGLPKEHLKENEHGYLDWFAYKLKFGFISIDTIRNQEAVAKYVTKYITKDLAKSVTDLNANMYYCSKGLKRAEELKRGTLAATNIPFDFSNEYCSVKWINGDIDIDGLIID